MRPVFLVSDKRPDPKSRKLLDYVTQVQHDTKHIVSYYVHATAKPNHT